MTRPGGRLAVLGLVAGLAAPVDAQVPIPRAPTDSAGPATVRDTVPADTVVYKLEALRVRATRPLVTTAGASGVRLKLDAPRVLPAPILAEALREMPFFQVRENSRGEAQLSLRGTEARQVAVLVDGIPLTLGWDARTDLSLIPLGAAREIQMFRGLSSILHGPNVLGGVVEIDIVRGPYAVLDPPPFQAEFGLDETGAAAVAAKVGHGFETADSEWLVRGGFAYRDRAGVPLASGVSEPLPADDGLRTNSDREHVSGFLAARYGARDRGPWASLSSFAFRASRGVPPELHVAEPRLWRIPETSRLVTALSGGTGWGSTPLGEGDLEASLGLDIGDTQIDAYESLAYRDVVEREFADDRTITARLLGDHTLAAGTLRAALTFADTRHIETVDPGDTSRFRQRLWSLAAEAEHPLAGSDADGLLSQPSLTVGVSLDGASTPETGGQEPRDALLDWGLRLGASAWLPSETARLHAGVSRRVRFPSLRELYAGALGRFVPNPELGPELLTVGELGITGEASMLEGQAVLFYQRWSGAIVRSSTGDGKFRRENRNRVTAAGVELLASLRLGEASIGGDLTLQRVALRDALAPATELEPEYQPEIFGGLEASGPLFAGIWGRVGTKYVGRQYCLNPELGEQERLDPSGRLDLLLTREWTVGGALGRLETTVGLDNATDAAIYDQCGLPRPGRSFRLQVRVG